jgi:hypothetical protein
MRKVRVAVRGVKAKCDMSRNPVDTNLVHRFNVTTVDMDHD